MNQLRQESGVSLLEMAVVLAVGAVLIIPMGAITLSLSIAPSRISEQIVAVSRTEILTQNINQDALSAQSFTPGAEPSRTYPAGVLPENVYGAFGWEEFGGNTPVLVDATYYWLEEKVWRIQERGGETGASLVIVDSVRDPGDLIFTFTPSEWVFDEETKEWTYRSATIEVQILVTREAGRKLADVGFDIAVSTAFRTQAERPVPLPGGGSP